MLSFRDAAADPYAAATEEAPRLASAQQFENSLAVANTSGEFPMRFVCAEWRDVVDAWQIGMLDAYASVPRLGRRSRLGHKQRERLWPLFEIVRAQLAADRRTTGSEVFAAAARAPAPFTHVVVDEAQDLDVPKLRWLASAGASLFFAGDLGQRFLD